MNLDTGQELMYNSLGLDGLFFLYILLSTYYSSLPNNGMNRNRKKKKNCFIIAGSHPLNLQGGLPSPEILCSFQCKEMKHTLVFFSKYTN